MFHSLRYKQYWFRKPISFMKQYILPIKFNGFNQGQALVSPNVGMVQKQDGGCNGRITNYAMITWLGVSVMHFEALFNSF